jgi:cobalamin biosynthesis protein CobD/CbiB
MSLFVLIAALLLEQFQPLFSRKNLSCWLFNYAYFFQHHFNAGEQKHGKIAWLLAVLPLLVCVVAVSATLHWLHPIFSFAFNVFVLYLTLGFRQFGYYFSDIQLALRTDNLGEARKLLSVWRGTPATELNAQEVARVAIEAALLAAHRNVFGIIVWFVVFSAIGLGGAAGALLYRLGQFLHQHWAGKNETELAAFGKFSQQAFQFLEWLPVRITALIFAIVGNFEDTMYCWRTQAASWSNKEEGIVLASGAGSIGVRLGMTIPQNGLPLDRAELGMGDDADIEFMRSTTGLIWRSAVFTLILLSLMTLLNLLG